MLVGSIGGFFYIIFFGWEKIGCLLLWGGICVINCVGVLGLFMGCLNVIWCIWLIFVDIVIFFINGDFNIICCGSFLMMMKLVIINWWDFVLINIFVIFMIVINLFIFVVDVFFIGLYLIFFC